MYFSKEEQKKMFDALYALIETKAIQLRESQKPAELIAFASLVKQVAYLHNATHFESAIEFVETCKELLQESV